MNNILFIGNIVMPVLAGMVYFFMAGYIKYIAPMRLLVTGRITYQGAFWGFIFFGIFLMTRPFQILIGPHPVPLIINNIREFFMIGLFSPAVFIGLLSFSLGHEKITKRFIVSVFVLCFGLAGIFAIVNVFAIGGSKEIFKVGKYVAYDGIWFHKSNPNKSLMPVLFVIRFLNPVMMMIIAGSISLWRSITFPKKSIYDNMPKKLLFQSFAVFSFGFSMLFCGFMFIFWNIPNQWWIYYAGALMAGFFEIISLNISLKKEVKI
jgi:two-component system response regulator YesN